jgi:hypothetical protein
MTLAELKAAIGKRPDTTEVVIYDEYDIELNITNVVFEDGVIKICVED